MKQLVLNIPEDKIPELKNYIQSIPDSKIINEWDYLISNKEIITLDESSETPIAHCLLKEKSNNLLKKKYGF